MSDLQFLSDFPFAAFVMSEFHEPEVARIVAREEAEGARAIGAEPCAWAHDPNDAGPGEPSRSPWWPCPGCEAAV